MHGEPLLQGLFGNDGSPSRKVNEKGVVNVLNDPVGRVLCELNVGSDDDDGILGGTVNVLGLGYNCDDGLNGGGGGGGEGGDDGEHKKDEDDESESDKKHKTKDKKKENKHPPDHPKTEPPKETKPPKVTEPSLGSDDCGKDGNCDCFKIGKPIRIGDANGNSDNDRDGQQTGCDDCDGDDTDCEDSDCDECGRDECDCDDSDCKDFDCNICDLQD